MSGYVGRGINYGNAVVDHFTGNGGATYTLTYDTTTDGVVISLDGVVQRNSTDFNIAGTALTFTSTVASPIAIQVIYTGLTQAIGVPGDNTVSGSKIAMGSDAQGDVLYYNGTDYVRLPKGTASQVLKMNSGATAPEWAADVDTTNTNASNLVSGTLPDARFPATLPAISGANLTNLPIEITKSSSNPTGTTNPSGGVGTIFLNTTTGEMYSCTDATTNANVWTNVGEGTGNEPYVLPTGGTVTTDGDYKVHTFNTNATFTVNSGAFTGGFDYLVVAGGGGGGGGYHGGGGGAGGYLTGTLSSLSSASYSITVGAGGSAGSAGSTDTGTQGGDGANSVFASITATGGGGGGTFAVPNGRNGGSGGGAGMSNVAGNAGSGTSGQGNDGGSRGSYSSPYSGAGGGGAGAVGTDGGATSAAHGGVGLSSSITGSAVFRAGGGGGGNRSGDTNGGNGGGGGGSYSGTAGAGTANTGGGGGAGGDSGTNGASGGSGVVIIRYQFQ